MIAENSDSNKVVQPISIARVGLYYHEAGTEPLYEIMPRGIERIELVTGGHGWVMMDGEWEEVSAGALLWHVEGDSTIARSDLDAPYRCLTIAFECTRYRGRRRVPHLTWWEDMDAVESFVSEVVRWHCHDQFDRDALLAYAYGRLFFQAKISQQLGKHRVLPERLQLALKILEERASEPLRLAQVAREVGWSAAYLHEIFQDKLQTTPHEVVIRRRLYMGKERLAGSDQPIKQIAAECGFSSASAFCHTFKERIGITPMEYRRRESGKS